MTHQPVQNLEADPKRQAIPTLNGYIYQIWHSVLRWVELGDDEILYLEGAEDIDLIARGEAETIQVKETANSGAVTLRSPDVVDALIHFWEHCQNNSHLRIRFRFLTTAERGLERPNPFEGERGLDYWDRCKRSQTDTKPLRTFLKENTRLPEDLRNFLATASDDELRDRLIKRIEWDTGREPQVFVEEQVGKRIISHGDKFGYLPSSSVNVIPHLLKRVCEVICQKENRRLDRQDFLIAFENATNVSVPANHLQRLMAEGQKGLLLEGNGGGKSEITVVDTQAPGAFPLSERFARRGELVSILNAKLNLKGVLVLKGSTGMGKSTLARLLVEHEGTDWKFLNFERAGPEETKNILLRATLADREDDTEPDYVIDDLNFDQSPMTYERQLEGFLSTIVLRGGRVIITTQGDFPGRIARAFDLPHECLFVVPSLDEEGVAQIAYNHGCPKDKRFDPWKQIIHAKSIGGHPLLVHAMVINLEARGWPEPNLEDLLSSDSIGDVRREYRKRLRDLLPSDGARKLLYRLSVFTFFFKRAHALKMACHAPQLESPSEYFDLLLGPWVEQVQEGYHRLSPLLYGSADEIFTLEEIKSLHQSAARSYLAERRITVTELKGAFFHGFIGEALDVLDGLYGFTLHAESEIWPHICHALEWLTYLRLERNTRLFPADSMLSVHLRHVQFRIAREIAETSLATQIAGLWEWEIEQLDSAEIPAGFKSANYFLLFGHVLYDTRFPLRPSVLVSMSVRQLSLIQEAKDDTSIKEIISPNAETFDDARFIVMNAASRYHKAEEIEEFFVSLHAQEHRTADRILAQLKNNDYFAALLLDGLWLNEVDAELPDWRSCIESVERVLNIGLAHSVDSIIAEAYRIKAIIHEEYLRDPQKALQSLDDGQAQLGGQHPILSEYRAKIFSLENREADALDLWEKTFPTLEQSENPNRIFSYRDAMIAAARLGKWEKAAEYALRAESATHKSQYDKSLALGFRADQGLALWLANKRTEALSTFVSILDELPAPTQLKSHVQFWWLYVKIAHTAQWMGQEFDGGAKYFQPPPGWFSDQKVDREIAEEPPNSYLYVLYFLAGLENRCGIAGEIFEKIEKACQEPTAPPAVKTGVALLQLNRSLKKLDLENLIQEYIRFAEYSKEYSNYTNSGVSLGSDSLIGLILTALFDLVAHGAYQQTLVSKWRVEAEKFGLLNESLSKVVDFIEYASNATEAQLITLREADNAHLRLAAAILLPRTVTISPDDRFRADATLLSHGHVTFFWREGTERLIEHQLADGWLTAIEEQSFTLLGSTWAVNQIRQACEDKSSHGVKKAARIILAAQNAVRTSLHPTLWHSLEQMAQ